MDHINNYTIGRGKIYFAHETNFDFFNTVGERYVGNSPGLMLNNEATMVDHFASDSGISELDYSVASQVNRSGTMIFDDISSENMELFFLGEKATVTQTATPVAAEEIAGALPGLFYQLGVSSANPQGVRGISSVTVTSNPVGTSYAPNVDYELDSVTGRIYIVPGGAIAGGSDLLVNYTPDANTRSRVVSGGRPYRGRMRYIEDNPAGQNRTFLLPLVEITPSGDFDLKGETWRQLPFALKPLKRGSMAAIWIDGVPQV